METYLIFWAVSIIGLIVSMIGGVWYTLSIFRAGGALRNSQIGIFIAASTWTLYSIFMIYFGFKRIDISDSLWLVVAIGYIIASAAYTYGTYTLIRFLKENGLL